MNGPEHYREAERLLAGPNPEIYKGDEFDRLRAENIAEAQVHATLALAAATAEPWVDDCSDLTGDYLHHDWVEALS